MATTSLEDEVRAALERDPRIHHPVEIAIVVRAGVVTLRGTVGSFKQRRAAAEDAKSLEGVDEVIDELTVDVHGDVTFDDDEIRGAALQMLIWDSEVPSDAIDVKVANGWVTLKGQVRHQYQSDAAFDDVVKLHGVGGITNKIRVVTA